MLEKSVVSRNPRSNNSTTGEIERKYHRGFAEPASAEQIMAMLQSKELAETVEAIRAGQEELKETLPFICPHYSRFRGNHRAQADIVPQEFTFRTCVDVDDLALVETAKERALQLNQDPLSEWEGMVEYIEYSARKKLHIWIRLPKGMTIAEAQQAFCEEIEVPYDESCITPERYIYMTGDEVYRSEKWLQPLSEEEIAGRREAYMQRGLDVDGRPFQEAKATGTKTTASQNSDSKSAAKPAADTNTSEVIPADKRTRFIVQEIMKKEGLTLADLTDKGGRHNAVKMLLAHATQLMKEGEFLGVISELMPQNWQDQNIRQLVRDFYAKYYDESAKLTEFQKDVFRRSRKMEAKQEEEETQEPQSELSKLYASAQPPQMPSVLPRLVKALTSQTPAIYKPTVAQASFPALATYPRRLSFPYIDNQERELRINCLTVAVTGSGKDTCIRQPLKHILADMNQRDTENRVRLRQFNEEYNSKASNKEKPKRPDDLIIQIVKSDITRAALIQRLDDAQGAPLFVKLNELEQWERVEGTTGRQNQFTNLKLTDDEENEFGADRAGTQSVTAAVSLHLNWVANTTTAKAQNFFRYVLIDGPISRLCLATIPEPEIGADIPVFGHYDKRYDDALKPFIENLKAATGAIRCPQALRLARQLKDECAEFARLSQDRVFDNLSHRALVHVFRKACLLYAANGMKWEKSIEEFCRWSLHYDLWIKLRLWGDAIRKADEQMQTSKRGPRNLLEQITTDADGLFSLRDAVNARLKNGMNEEGTGNMLSQWKKRGYIEALPDGRYKKVAKG